MSTYWERKIKELEKEKKSTYWERKTAELEKQPIRTPQFDDIAPVSTVSSIAPVQDDGKWYESGLFKDGYDFGDVTKTILGISDKKELKTFTKPDTDLSLEEMKQRLDYLNSKTWRRASEQQEQLTLTQQYNQMALAEYAEVLSKTKLEGQNHSVLEEIEILANMESGDEKDKRKQAVLDKMTELGMDTEFYAHFAGDGDFNFDTLRQWGYNAAMAGLNTFNKGLLDTADVLLGAPMKALGWENNPISTTADYYGDLYSKYRYNADILSEKLGGDAWNFGTTAVEGTMGALPTAIMAMMTGGASLPNASTLMHNAAMQTGNFLTKAGLTVETMMKNPQFWTSFARTLGPDYKEAKENGVSDTAAAVGSVLKAFVNSGIEIGLDGGSGIQGLYKSLDQGTKAFWAWVESSFEEGLEEIAQKFVGEVIDKFGYGSEEEMLNPIEYATEGLIGSISGMALGGGQIAVKKGVDTVVEHKANKLNDLEQTVADKLVEKEIASREAKGKKISASDKANIKKTIEAKLRKGFISANDIESVLGGEDYTAFTAEQDKFFASEAFQNYSKAKKDAQKRIARMQKQLEELGEQPNTVKNSKRYDAIQNRIDTLNKRIQTMHGNLIPEANRIMGMRNKMRSQVMGTVMGTRLAESYYEMERKNQKFQVDINKYTNENARKTVQSILDADIKDNSNEFHATVDFLASLSEQKGVTFTFTKDELLKGTEHYREGYVTHGFVDDDGNIVLNKDSDRVINTTVGHEITHVLEKAGVYLDLQRAVQDFAISKEGLDAYNARIKEAEAIYKGKKNTTAEKEVTADLIGEYLFNDYDFVSNLANTDQGTFKHIWNEIKSLAKIAGVGSKEARELERVKRLFDKAWRERTVETENVEASDADVDDVQHSISVDDKKTLDFLNEQISRGEYDAETNPDGGYYVTYKSMSFWGYDEDGNAILRSPMAEYVDGELSNAYLIPKDKSKLNWYQSTETIDEKTGMPSGLLVATETPSKKSPNKMTTTYLPAFENQHLIAEDWSNLYFNLRKKIWKDGKWENSDVKARYNPYEHSSDLMLNDQFKAAWRRDNLVTVKMYVPRSEDNGTFRAQWSKDPTGWTDWKSGDVAGKINAQKDLPRRVYLSRYAAPVEIVPDSEVAQAYKSYLEGTNVEIPDNVVSPNLLKELKNAGVPIKESGKVQYSMSEADSFAKDILDAKSIQYSYSAIPSHKKSLEKNFDIENASMDLETINQRYDKIIDIWERLGGELDSKFLNDWNNKVERPFTIFKAQSGYKYNVELSSMCKKGVPLFEAIDTIVKKEVMKELGMKTMGKDEKEILYDILKQKHFEIPCAICYVEQARQREGVIIDAFLNGKTDTDTKGNVKDVKLGWNQVLDSVQKEMKANGVDYNFSFVSRDIATDKYIPADSHMDEQSYTAFAEAVKKIANEEITRYNQAKGKNRPLLKEVTPEAVKECFKGTLPSNLKIFKVLLTEPSSRFKIQNDLLYSSMTTKNLTMAHNGLYSLFNSQGGVSGYKTKQAPTVYWGEILGKKWKPADTRKEGGIRNQSNSDFQMYTLLDQAQMYMDFSAKGYYLQAYTKVLSELKLFGLSRGKINASLIPQVKVYRNADGSVDVEKTMANAGLDENGNPIYDDIEGINHTEAFMLLEDPDYSKNIGGICIGYSDNHIRKLLDDNRVQLIIGFHDKTNDPNKRYRGAKYAKNYNGLNEATKLKADGTTETVHIGFNPFIKKAENKFKYNKETETFEGTVTYNGKTYTADDIPRLATDLYLEHCAKKGLTPAYNDFSGHRNYYKLLADFSLYDSEGHYAPHQKVAYNMPDTVPYLDADGNKQYMNSEDYIKIELQKELAVRDSLIEALADDSEDGIIPRFKAEVEKRNQYSMSKASELENAYKYNLDNEDMLGAEMVVEEMANLAMPDSKIRGKDGRLIPLYHGTKEQFWEFDTSIGGGKNGTAEGFGIYLSDDQEVTEAYGDRQLKMYANITKPATSSKKTITAAKLAKLIESTCKRQAEKMVADGEHDTVKDALFDTWVSNYVYTYDMGMARAYQETAKSILQMDDNDMAIIQEVMAGMGIRDYAEAMEFYRNSLTPITGFDGFATQWSNGDHKSNIYLAFDSSQLKSADAVTYDDSGNVIPLSERFNPEKKDIRYSMSKAADKDYLDAVNRGDMETIQKLVREAAKKAGYDSEPLYHGTQQFGFTKIDLGESDDQISFFATDSLEVARTYSSTDDPKQIYSKPTADIDELVEAYQDRVVDFVERVNRVAGFYNFMDYDDVRLDEFRVDIEEGISNYADVEEALDDYVEEIIHNLYKQNHEYEDDMMIEAFYDSDEVQAIYEASGELYNTLKAIADWDDGSAGNYQLYANTEGLFEIDADGERWNRIPFQSSSGEYLVDTRRLAQYAKAEGYKGVKITNVFDDGGRSVHYQAEPATVYIFFDPQSQVKSADPVTYDDNGQVIPLSQRFNPENKDIRYSQSKDNEGNQLTIDQTEFFKDSKIRDNEGNLRRVYHTTQNDFTVFDHARKGEATDGANTFLGFFFAESPDHMSQFPEFQNGKTDSYYLDMKNPMDLTNLSREAFMDIVELTGGDRLEAADIYDQELEAERGRARLRGDNNTSLSISQLLYSMVGDYYHADFFDALKPNYDKLIAKGYDGVIDYLDEMMGEREFVVFDSNQAKLTSNQNPTSDPDTRYAMSKDSRTIKQGYDDPFADFAPVNSTVQPKTQLPEENSPVSKIAPKVTPVAETNVSAENEWQRERLASLDDKDAPPIRKIQTVKERLEVKMNNFQRELTRNTKLREQSKADYDAEIAKLQAEYDAKQNKQTKVANGILRRIERLKRMKGNVDADFAKRISDLQSKITKVREELRSGVSPSEQGKMRVELHESIINDIKTTFSENGLDFDETLKNAKNLSTFQTVDNTPQRVMEKSLGYKEGGILSDITVNKVAQNETEGIKWLNAYVDQIRKISEQYGIKPGSKESAAAQMYAEGFYVNDKNEIVQYGDRELAADFPDYVKRSQIKGLARDSRIRKIYDDTLKAINESRARNAYPEIQKLDNYFLHFRAMEDTFSRLGLPFNPNDIRAKDLPTDLNGVTADLKPGQPYFASAQHRTGKRTSFDLLGGLEKYLNSAKNQIFHIDDIQTLRALRNYVAETYGQSGLEGLDLLTEEEAQERIKQVYGSHLSTFAKFLNEEANVIAGKTALIDRGIEGIIGRRGIAFLNTVNRQVGSNMVGFNISSSLTNFLPVVQAFAKTNKADFVKAFAQTVSNRIGSISGRNDGFNESSPVAIRRKGADRFYRTPYQKISDPGYALLGAVDSISTELIARTKYNELTRNGMDTEQAHIETDKWVSRLMGDRSLGQQPQLFNSKMLGLLTKFQLEVRNQLDSQFYDTIQEAKVSNEHIQNQLARNAKTAAKVTSTFFQLAVVQHLFGKAFESIAGYNPAFDIISALIKAFGWDDEEEEPVLDNIEQAFFELMEDMPYVSTMTGGRIPISSALPIEELYKGEDQYGNEKSRLETLAEAAPYYILPGGYGQIKKTFQGLDMFSDEHPVAGSYTDSGNLRFPVEDTLGNRVQAALFGQWANDNARDYFDNDRKALNEKQIQEFQNVGMTIQDYRDYRENLSGLGNLEDKMDYINSLPLTTAQKNLLVNNLTDRKEPIDMSDYDEFGSLEEFDYANKNPEKYAFFDELGISYQTYKNADDDTKEAYDWAYNNPEKYTLSKAVSDDYMEYHRYRKDLSEFDAKNEYGETVSGLKKERVTNYINSLNIDYGKKIILYRSMYNSQADRDAYNQDILEYLNSRSDISFEDTVTILRELGFTVTDDGKVYWD